MSLRDSGAQVRGEWQERFQAWREAFPELAADWDLAWAGRLRDGWRETLPRFDPGEKLATRAAGQQVMAAFGSHAPTMIGGAADLVESTKTLFEGAGEFSKVLSAAAATCRSASAGARDGRDRQRRRRHGGIVSPYGSTFLMFSDYMRGSVRVSALMGLPVVWVWIHDSVGLGEDGPTHQPIEHYASLRAIPELWVIRPGDANETAQAWRVALEREDGPVALLLSRQGVETLDRSALGAAEELERGGYVLWDSADAGAAAAPPELILISTGSEVPLTLAAARKLVEETKANVRVVSMPCIELFEAQTQEYRDSVLPPGTTARLAVEPGASISWWKWVGSGGDVLGIDRFGASAPGAKVLEELGFSVENILARAAALLERKG